MCGLTSSAVMGCSRSEVPDDNIVVAPEATNHEAHSASSPPVLIDRAQDQRRRPRPHRSCHDVS